MKHASVLPESGARAIQQRLLWTTSSAGQQLGHGIKLPQTHPSDCCYGLCLSKDTLSLQVTQPARLQLGTIWSNMEYSILQVAPYDRHGNYL